MEQNSNQRSNLIQQPTVTLHSYAGYLLVMLLTAATLSAATPTVTAPEVAAPTAEDVVRWLRQYIEIDTTNPPGNEKAGATYLAGLLAAEGIAAQLLTSPSGRTSLYARLEASAGSGAGIVLLHHMDVVPAGASWQTPPFSGRLEGERIWGRGAVDMKSYGIAQLAAFIDLARSGVPRQRDVIYLAVADEELGGGEGAGWLVEAHPELFADVAAVLNEGGGNRVVLDRLLWWGIEVTQKRPLWLRVTARGRGGHASAVAPQSATHRLIQSLARLVARPQRYRVSPATRPYLGALAGVEGGRSADLFSRLDTVITPEGPREPIPPDWPTYFLDTLQVTEIDNGSGRNVIAGTASAYVDMRLLPDTDADALLTEVQALLGDGVEVEVLLRSPPVAASPTDHLVFQALTRTLSVRAPVIPVLLPGTTDSRYFRARGIPAYGFSPFSINGHDLRGIHAVDEFIRRDDFLRGIETMRRVLYACVEG